MRTAATQLMVSYKWVGKTLQPVSARFTLSTAAKLCGHTTRPATSATAQSN